MRRNYFNKPVYRDGIYIGYTDGSVSPYNELVPGLTPEGIVLKYSNIRGREAIMLHPRNFVGAWGTLDRIPELPGLHYEEYWQYGKENTEAIIASGYAGSAFDAIRSLGNQWYMPESSIITFLRGREGFKTALDLIGGDDFNLYYQYVSTTVRAKTAGFDVVLFVNYMYWTGGEWSTSWKYSYLGDEFGVRAIRDFDFPKV